MKFKKTAEEKNEYDYFTGYYEYILSANIHA